MGILSLLTCAYVPNVIRQLLSFPLPKNLMLSSSSKFFPSSLSPRFISPPTLPGNSSSLLTLLPLFSTYADLLPSQKGPLEKGPLPTLASLFFRSRISLSFRERRRRRRRSRRRLLMKKNGGERKRESGISLFIQAGAEKFFRTLVA